MATSGDSSNGDENDALLAATAPGAIFDAVTEDVVAACCHASVSHRPVNFGRGNNIVAAVPIHVDLGQMALIPRISERSSPLAEAIKAKRLRPSPSPTKSTKNNKNGYSPVKVDVQPH
ncbi:hypothetical protein V6N13_126521 [Hibiscus sabdariffa]|uniref:Uncharacterized protein n=1 Tax=Hibiscus sabdariffa TaxID=183260 RepID=A0ABR2RFP4_9ROSI